MNNPTIDIIIPVYNGALFIREAIQSVLNQTWQNFRIIVTDDGSEDHTVAVVTEMAALDDRIVLLKRPHSGIPATLNAALAQVNAEYVSFVDADDHWHPQKLEKQFQQLQQNGLSACFCLIKEFETFNPEDGSPLHQARSLPLKGYGKMGFLGKSALFSTYGTFDESFPTGDFVEWYSRLIRDNVPTTMLEEVLCYRRVHKNNNTSTNNKNDYLQILKAHLDEKRKSR